MRYFWALALMLAASLANAGLVTVNYSGVVNSPFWDVGPHLVNAGDTFYGSITYDDKVIEQCGDCVIGGFLQVGDAPLIVLPNNRARNPVTIYQEAENDSRLFFWEAGREIWTDWYIEDWWLELGDFRTWMGDDGNTIHLAGFHATEGLGTSFGLVGYITSLSRVEHGVAVPEPATGSVLLLGLIGVGLARSRRKSATTTSDRTAAATT